MRLHFRSFAFVSAALLAVTACHKPATSLLNAPGNLKAGAGQALIDLPIGIPTAGYEQSTYLGFQMPADEPGSPYANFFPATRGMESPPMAKAVVFDNGVNYMVIAKIDAVGITDVLTERVIQLAQQQIKGKFGTLKDKLILNADHTHDAGCRFSRDSVYAQLCQELGFAQSDPGGNALAHGFDTYSQEATDRVASSIVAAIQQAVSTLQPAKFGYATAEDTDDLAGHSRRCANWHLYGNDFHDQRSLVMRVDNSETGAPIAIMFNFAMHGTFYDIYNHSLSTDAPGHSEYFVEEQFDKPVVAMYLQGNAGDVSPSGGSNDGQNGEGSSEDMQHAGWELSRQVMGAYNSVSNWQDDIPLQVHERWSAISYDILGYPPQNTDGYFYPYGAVLCYQLMNNNGTNPGCTPPIQYTPADIMTQTTGLPICFTPILAGQMVNGVPTGTKYATRFAAARIGDLALAVVPGEPVSETGKLIEQGLLSGEFQGIRQATVIGYSQDHNGYLLQDEDWLSGGYEPTITFWGWKFGAYTVQQNIDTFREMFTGKAQYAHTPAVLPNLQPDSYTAVVPTSSVSSPAVTQDVPATSPRITPIDVTFTGGDPGLGTPLITLQMQTSGGYVDVTKPTPSCGDLTASCWTSGWIKVSNLSEYDFTVFYTSTPTYKANPSATTRTHTYEFNYEPPIDLPAGTYRFHIVGQVKLNGAQSQYDLTTSPVQITPNTTLTIDSLLTPSNGELVFDGTLLYPQGLGIFNDTDNPDWQKGNFRALTPRWGNQFSPAVPASTIPAGSIALMGDDDGASVTFTYVERTVPDTAADYLGHPDQGSSLHAEIPVSGSGTYVLDIPAITDVYGNSSQATSVQATIDG